MKPKRLAQLTCANWRTGGTCAGVQINKDLSQWIDPELAGKQCCVNEDRCSYFKRIVIPGIRGNPEHPDHHKLMAGVIKYERAQKNLSGNVRRCKRCKRPTPGMKANQRFCPDCKRIRIAESKREYKRRSKGEKVST